MRDAGGVRARLSVALAAMLVSGGATFATVGTLTAKSATAAVADMTDHATALPGPTADMVVDPASSRVFVSVPSASEVVALDFSGDIVGTITEEAGANGLVMLDGDLYVVAANAGAVDEIDTTTLTRTRRMASGLAGMTDIATAAGALWVTTSDWALHRIARDGSVSSFPGPLQDGAGVAGNPADQSKLIVYTPDWSPVRFDLLDVSGSQPQVVAASGANLESVTDVVVSPDGRHLVTNAANPYQFEELNTGNLTLSGVVYPGNSGYPQAVATTAANGGLFAGGIEYTEDGDPNVVVYRLDDSSTMIGQHGFGANQVVAPRGMQFSPDGTKLFVVASDPATGVTDILHVLGVPAPSGDPAPPSQPGDHGTRLPGPMYDMVVDPATHRVFVSIPGSNDVVGLDFAGNVVGIATHEAGASGLALLDGHLYVVAANAGTVDELDTTTLRRTRTMARGLAGMADIATAEGALWVGTSDDWLLHRIEVDGSMSSFPIPPLSFAWGVVTDPGDSSKLILYTPTVGPEVDVVDVSGPEPTLLVEGSVGGSIGDTIVMSPDGRHFVPAGAGAYEFAEENTSDLAPDGIVYPASPGFAGPVAMSGARGGLFAGLIGYPEDAAIDLDVYRLDDPSTVIAQYSLGADQIAQRSGMAFSPDGSKLFVVTGDDYPGGSYSFRVLDVPDAGGETSPPSSGGLAISPRAFAFGNQRVGTYGAPQTVTVTNGGTGPATITAIGTSGANARDFFGTTTCRVGHALAAGASCTATIAFGALGLGARHASLVVETADASASASLTGKGTEGYEVADARGGVVGFGDANVRSVADHALAAPVVGITATPNGEGFWLLARDGGIFSYGNAKFYGSTGAMRLNEPIVGMARTPTGRGYWLVASDGGIFSFGDARFYGSTGAMHLNRPIVGMAATPSGKGYWLVASDGGIFSFGDAKFHGSTGNLRLARPIVGMAATPSGRGYELVANDGGVFTFGDAHFSGSAARSGARVVGIASTPTGRGYWLVSSAGEVFHYGDAPGDGGASTSDVVGIAATAPPLPPVLLGGSTGAPAAATVIRLGSRTSAGLAREVDRP
jgi:sugar lactone lactonase YvrE